MSKKLAVATLLMALLFEFSIYVNFGVPKSAEAALVTIESTPSTAAVVHTLEGSATVFIDDLVGYKFFRTQATPAGRCGYRKTIDAGANWGSFVAVDTQTDCSGISVWYDRWTPGDTGSNIHIATIDTSDDHIFYNRLNTADDTLLLTTATSTTLGSTATYAAATNRQTITKSTTGLVYVASSDAQGTQIRSCSSNCNVSTNWSSVGTPPQGNIDAWDILLPLSGGNILLINRTLTNTIRSSVWNGSFWSSFNNIDTAATRSNTNVYDVGMAATLNHATGDIYLVYTADNDNFTTADHDIRTALYSGGSWSTKADIVTNDPVRGLQQVAIGLDQNTADVYVAFTARAAIASTTSSNVFFVRSTTTMNSWEAEQGPVNSVTGDFYGIDLNLMSYDRLFVSWFDNVTATRAIYGDTLANIGPDAKLTALGSHVSVARVDTTDLYIGGGFLLEAAATQTVTNIVISEGGSIHAQDDLANIKLLYDLDTTAPYNCVSESYSGSETQFGPTVVNGFSGANGVASFTASPVTISPTQVMCIYIVMDVLPSATDGDTIQVFVNNPKDDIVVSSGAVDVFPSEPVYITGSTTLQSPSLTQTGYHWRNDDGTEADATSATLGTENTILSGVQAGEALRLRMAVENLGSTSSVPTVFKMQYSTPAPTCSDSVSWTDVNTSNAIFTSTSSLNLIHGDNTTNISNSLGGVTNIASSFVGSNQGVRTQSATTTALSLSVDSFVEYEFSLTASTSATEGETYCFRLVGNDQVLTTYDNYARLTLSADVTVQTIGSLIATTGVGTVDVYSGGTLVVVDNVATRTVSEITIAEVGSITADTALDNVRLFYELDTTAPYNCASESYAGTEDQFGITSIFPDTEVITFSDSVSISTSSALCLYLVYDVTSSASNGETIDFAIISPSSDVVVSSGSVGPSATVGLSGETLIEGAILTQTGYHWRNDDGTEADASSATSGSEDTALYDFVQNTPIRLRLGVSNNGVVSSIPVQFRLEYAPKISTCDMATVWTDVGAALDGWDMFDSAYLTNGDDTTNIATSTGGLLDGNSSFLSPNAAVRDTDSSTATTTLANDEFIELEYAITSTDLTAYSTTYCFRVSAAGLPLQLYNTYAELTTAPKRDFKIQRGTAQLSTTTTNFIAGVDYEAPASSSRAYVLITNSHNTGAGHNTGGTGAQTPRDVTAYISDANDLTTSFTITRPPSALNNTRVAWELVEFIGDADTDNELVVRGVGTVNFTNSMLVATGSVVSGVVDPSKLVIFITGAANRNTGSNHYAGQVTAEWNATSSAPIIRRGATGSSIIDVSYVVVEFVGVNWQVQRVEHAYATSSVVETKSINPVNSLARTFLHVQKRMGATTNVIHFGHEVWLSSIGVVSFKLETNASVAVEQTSVAWVIENLQTGVGAMKVQRANGTQSGSTPPVSISVILSTPVESLNNTSISANTRAAGANNTHPRAHAGFTMTSTSTFELWRSNVGSLLTYRTEIIEWPVADLSYRQNYYRLYVHNNSLTPSDPWPMGVADLGENAAITASDEPLGIGERVRLRMSIQTKNANLPAGLQQFKLQYGQRVTTCSAITAGNWFDVGGVGSSTIWRGFSATGTTDGTALGTNPPSFGQLLLSVSDVAGTIEHSGPSAPNPYLVPENDDLEYDWHLEHNGANAQSVYCFRMVRDSGQSLEGYFFYPQIRTAGFTPLSQNWRWYQDAENETPTTSLANENVAPANIDNGEEIALRISVRESRGVTGSDIKYKLQFSEDSNFQTVYDVVATSSCQDRSYWCYANGPVTDNTTITTQLLTDGSGCISGSGNGCGSHNSQPNYVTGHVHYGSMVQEFSFTIRHVAARVNAVYYFRLYDVTNNEPVLIGNGETYPSLITAGPSLVLSIAGLPSGTTTAGITTNIETTPMSIGFGALTFGTIYNAAQRITVTTNATEGYQVLKYARQQLLSSKGESIQSVAGTNQSPVSWATGCQLSMMGCVGYHTTDAVLSNGSTRFAPLDTYAGLHTTPQEVMYSSIPVDDTHDIVYRIQVRELQPAGDYETELIYLAVPAY